MCMYGKVCRRWLSEETSACVDGFARLSIWGRKMLKEKSRGKGKKLDWAIKGEKGKKGGKSFFRLTFPDVRLRRHMSKFSLA